MSLTENQQFNIREGTVSFWVPEGVVDWSDNKLYRLFEVSEGGNSILIIKDNDKKLKFFHVFLGNGRTDIEYDISNLSVLVPHNVVVTWSVTTSKLQLYIDGALVSEKTIEYKIN